MAFENLGLYLDRGSFNGDKSAKQLAEHSYRTDDTLSTVSTISFDNPYFPPYLNATPEQVQIGDLMEISASDGYGRFKIIALSPFAIIQNSDINPDPDFNNITTHTITFDQTSTPPGPSQLSFYAENAQVTLTFTGAYSSPVETTAIVSRIGNMVIMNVPAFSGIVNSSNAIFADLPDWLAPIGGSGIGEESGYLNGYEQNNPFMGKATVSDESPILTIRRVGYQGGQFVNTGGTMSIESFTISYLV